MSYEKVKVNDIRTVVKKDTGETHNFLSVEVLQSFDIYMNDTALKLLPTFEKIKGREVLLPVAWGEYKGKPNLNFADDCVPLPIPGRT